MLTVGSLTLDPSTHEVARRGVPIELTTREYSLLEYLAHREGQVVSRKAMLEDVWNLHEDTDTRAIDHFIARLRKYIEKEPGKPQHLLTVRGVGYKFVEKTRK